MDPLRLIAFDRDDLDVVSAHLQDAVLHVGDIHWLAGERRLVVACNRFDWEATVAPPRPDYRRRRSALRFERVMSFKARGIDPAAKDRVLNLLAVEFADGDAPAGTVTLIFSGGAAARLEVECLECELADLGPAWTTTCCPDHPDLAATAADTAAQAKPLQG